MIHHVELRGHDFILERKRNSHQKENTEVGEAYTEEEKEGTRYVCVISTGTFFMLLQLLPLHLSLGNHARCVWWGGR